MTTHSPDPNESALSPIAPRTPVEADIAKMAATVLGLPVVGVEDNLLVIGGASLELGQLVVRMRQRYGVDVLLAPFFRTPTVAYLASLVQWPESGSDEH